MIAVTRGACSRSLRNPGLGGILVYLREFVTRSHETGYHVAASVLYPGSMQFVAEAILPSYLEALQKALEDAIRRLPPGGPRRVLVRLRRRLGKPATAPRFESLHRLASMGEAQGWLTTEESITIRKLAYRCSFYLRRSSASRADNPE